MWTWSLTKSFWFADIEQIILFSASLPARKPAQRRVDKNELKRKLDVPPFTALLYWRSWLRNALQVSTCEQDISLIAWRHQTDDESRCCEVAVREIWTAVSGKNSLKVNAIDIWFSKFNVSIACAFFFRMAFCNWWSSIFNSPYTDVESFSAMCMSYHSVWVYFSWL